MTAIRQDSRLCSPAVLPSRHGVPCSPAVLPHAFIMGQRMRESTDGRAAISCLDWAELYEQASKCARTLRLERGGTPWEKQNPKGGHQGDRGIGRQLCAASENGSMAFVGVSPLSWPGCRAGDGYCQGAHRRVRRRGTRRTGATGSEIPLRP